MKGLSAKTSVIALAALFFSFPGYADRKHSDVQNIGPNRNVSGRIFKVLGGLFLPEGISSLDWTPQVAEETASFLKKISDPQDKLEIQRQVISLLIDFFQSGLASLTISRNSSGTNPQNISDSGSGDRSISATGG